MHHTVAFAYFAGYTTDSRRLFASRTSNQQDAHMSTRLFVL